MKNAPLIDDDTDATESRADMMGKDGECEARGVSIACKEVMQNEELG